MWSSSAGVRTTRYGCQNRILSQCMVFYIEFFALSSLLSNILAQTSADGDMSLFKVGGAMTNAFVRAMAVSVRLSAEMRPRRDSEVGLEPFSSCIPVGMGVGWMVDG
mmetsp:Transcript_39542/g.105126  ORF Transcript_39542/g.105126 Transcript_39542/m.105126 type:complete len:107 (+) Transcript_39542:572-892(+)